MRHMLRGRQLSRDTEHRKALRRNLVQSLFEHGKIRTTEPKAKEVKSFAEKLITLAREKTLNNRRRVIQAPKMAPVFGKLGLESGPMCRMSCSRAIRYPLCRLKFRWARAYSAH